MSDLKEPLVRTKTRNCRLRRGGVTAGVASLFSGTVGCGILSLPFAMSESGLLLGIGVLLFSASALTFYYAILCWGSEETGDPTYVGIIEKLCGGFWRRVTEASIIFHSLGTLAAVQMLIATMLLSLLRTCGWEAVDDYRTSVIVLYNIIFIILIMPEEVTSLRYLSSLAVLAAMYIALVVIFETPSYISNTEDLEIPMAKISINLVNSLALIIFAFDSSRLVPIVYSELNPRSFLNMLKVLVYTVCVVGGIYMCIAVCGMVSQGEETSKLVIDRVTATGEPAENDIPMVIGRAAMVVVLLVAYPVHFSPLKLSMQQLISGAEFYPSTIRYYVVTVGCWFITFFLVVAVADAVIVFKVVGGIFVVFTSCILPNLVYTKITELWKSALLWVVTAGISVVGFTSAILAIMG